MVDIDRRRFIQAVGAATGTTFLGSSTAAAQSGNQGAQDPHSHCQKTDDPFVGTWTAPPVPPGNSGYTCRGFKDQTLRLIAHTSVGGPSIRIRLSNTFGD